MTRMAGSLGVGGRRFSLVLMLILLGLPAMAYAERLDEALDEAEALTSADPLGAIDLLDQLEPASPAERVRYAIVRARAQVFIGQSEAARESLEAAEDAFERVDAALQSTWFRTQATVAFSLGESEQALASGRRAIDLLDPGINPTDYAEALTVALQVALGAFEYGEALGYATALQNKLAEMPLDLTARRDAHLMLGALHQEFGEFDKSREAYRLAAEESIELGDVLGEADARYALTRLLIQTGRLDEAAGELDRLVRIYDESNDAFGQAMVAMERARLALMRDDFASADQLSTAAIDQLDRLSVPLLARAAYFISVESKLEMGRPVEARQLLDAMLAAYDGAPSSPTRFELEARVAAALADWEAAYRASRTEIELMNQATAERLSRASEQARARLDLATERVRRAELEAALELQAVEIQAAARQDRLQRIALGLAAALLILGGALVYRLLRQGRQLSYLAMRDPLTQLANRRSFLSQAENELRNAQRQGIPVSLLMIDLDHFKRVNDGHGHDTGDQVLAEFAEVMRQVARGSDLPARLGGEEFAVLLPRTDAVGSMRVAERLMSTLAASAPFAEGRIEAITISIGVATSATEASLNALMKVADDALYRAKEMGRNRVELGPVEASDG